nr:unnamed protein product [Callosobruchus chinensis]
MRHNVKDKLTCPRCQKSYSHKSSLYNHVAFECGKEPNFKCTFCIYKAKRKHCLKDHLYRIHNVDPKLYI